MRKSAIVLSAALLLAASSSTDSLLDAVGKDDVDKVRALLEDGSDVNAAPGDGMSALHRAARTGSLAMADLLIGAGANLEAKTRLGEHTPLHVASASGRSEKSSAIISGDLRYRSAFRASRRPAASSVV